MSISGFSQPQLSGLQIGRTSINGATIQSDGPSIYNELKTMRSNQVDPLDQLNIGVGSLLKVNHQMFNELVNISSILTQQLDAVSQIASQPVQDFTAMFTRWSGSISSDIREDVQEMSDQLYGRYSRNLSSLQGSLFDLMDPRGPLFMQYYQMKGSFDKYFNITKSLEESLYDSGSGDSQILREMETMAEKMRLPFETARLLLTPSTLIMRRYDHPDMQQVALLGALFDVTREVAQYQIAQAKIMGVNTGNIRQRNQNQTFWDYFMERLNSTPVIGNLYRIGEALITLKPLTAAINLVSSVSLNILKAYSAIRSGIGAGFKKVFNMGKDIVDGIKDVGVSGYIGDKLLSLQGLAFNKIMDSIGFNFKDQRTREQILEESGLSKDVSVKVQDATLQIPLLLEPIRNNTEKMVNFLEAIYQTITECCKDKINTNKRNNITGNLYKSLQENQERIWHELSGQFMSNKQFQEVRAREEEIVARNIENSVNANKGMIQTIIEGIIKTDKNIIGKQFVTDTFKDIIKEGEKQAAKEHLDITPYFDKLEEYQEKLDNLTEEQISIEKQQAESLQEIVKLGKSAAALGMTFVAGPIIGEIIEDTGLIAGAVGGIAGSLTSIAGSMLGIAGSIAGTAIDTVLPDIISTPILLAGEGISLAAQGALTGVGMAFGAGELATSAIGTVAEQMPNPLSPSSVIAGAAGYGLSRTIGGGQIDKERAEQNVKELKEIQDRLKILEDTKSLDREYTTEELEQLRLDQAYFETRIDRDQILDKEKEIDTRKQLLELNERLSRVVSEKAKNETKLQIEMLDNVLKAHEKNIDLKNSLEETRLRLLNDEYDSTSKISVALEAEIAHNNLELTKLLSSQTRPSIVQRVSDAVKWTFNDRPMPMAVGGSMNLPNSYLVGEAGPELTLIEEPTVISGTSGYVFNPKETKELLKSIKTPLIPRAAGGDINNESIFQESKEKFAKSVDVTTDDQQQTLNNIDNVLNKIYSFFIKKDNEEKSEKMFSSIFDIFGGIKETLGTILAAIAGSSLLGAARSVGGTLLGGVGAAGSAILGAAGTAGGMALRGVKSLLSGMLPRIGALAAGVISSPLTGPVLTAGLAIYGISTIGKALIESGPKIIEAVKEGFSGFVGWIDNSWNDFSVWTKNTWENFKKSVTDSANNINKSEPLWAEKEKPFSDMMTDRANNRNKTDLLWSEMNKPMDNVVVPQTPTGALPIGNASYMSLVDQKRLSQTATSTSMMDKYDEQFKIAGSQTNLDSQLLKTIAAIETGGISADKRESYIVNPNNPNSATGLMQIIGITAKDIQSINDRYYNGEKLDRTDAESSINGTARYIRHRILPILDKNNVLQGTNVLNDLIMLGYSRGPTYTKDSLQTYFDMKGLSYEEGLNLLKSENKLPEDFIMSLRDRSYRASQINAKEGQEYLARASRLNLGSLQEQLKSPELLPETPNYSEMLSKIPEQSGLGYNRTNLTKVGPLKFKELKSMNPTLEQKLLDKYVDKNSYKLSNPNVNISGLDQNMFEKFQQMATEYKEITGNPIQINSAYRSIEHQEQLYNSMPKGMAAKPGRSMHNFGQAIDIQSEDGNRLDQLGLLNKYGFSRPLLPAEPWHIELAGLDKEKIRAGIIPELGNMNIKEPINNIGNMPTSNSDKLIADNIQRENKEIVKPTEKVKTPLDSTASLNQTQQPLINIPAVTSDTTTSNGSNGSSVLEESSIFGKLIARISKNAVNNFVDNYSRLFIDRSLPVVGV